MASSTLVFIDSRLEDYQSLVQGIDPAADLVLLDSEQDGVEQIAATLADRTGVTSLHIFSHGEPGTLHLGRAQLSIETLGSYANQMKRWATALTASADLLIYGCRVAAGDRGDRFLQQIRQLTGANVAASANLTGSLALGGDWNLERQLGTVQSASVLSAVAMADYASVMAICIPNLLYGVSANGGVVSQVSVLNLGNGASTPVGSLAFNTFSIARQATTGFLYYVEQVASGSNANARVAYLDPATGQNTILPNPTGVDVQFLKLAQSQDGTIYGLTADSTNLYAINPTTGSAIDLGVVAGGGFRAGSGDAAFNPTNPNQLLVSAAGTNRPEQFYQIYTVDVTTRQAALVGEVTLNGQSLASQVGDDRAGALAFGEDGQLYGNVDNVLYRIDQTTAVATRIGSTGFDFTDFATLPTPTAQVDLILTKNADRAAAAPGETITYTIEVTNTTTDCDINGITVTDFVNEALTGVTWSAAITGNGSFPTPGDFSGSGNAITSRINLGAQARIIYTVRGTVSSSARLGSILSNSATVTIPPGFIDPPGNNTSPPITVTIVEGEDPDCLPGVNRRGNATQNRLRGDNDINVLRGLGGSDNMRGFGCPDRIFAGRGSDLVRGGDGSDTLQGQQGNDRLNGGRGNDVVNGGLGIDVLLGNRGSDSLRGGRGNDQLFGEAGNDRLIGNQGNDRISGGSGDDVLRGRINSDVLSGNAGTDRLLGGLGSDRLAAGAGNDFANGGKGNDVLLGGGGNDVLLGKASNDRIDGGDGRDVLRGQLNNDRLFGGRQADRLLGGTGSDRLEGSGGNDFLNGGRGDDVLRGGANDDTLIGRFGADVLTGGSGKDRFTYLGLQDEGDRITDFNRADDLIDLSQVFADSRYDLTRRFARYVKLEQSGSSTTVELDFNGDRPGGFQPFITLEGVVASTLTARNFVVV